MFFPHIRELPTKEKTRHYTDNKDLHEHDKKRILKYLNEARLKSMYTRNKVSGDNHKTVNEECIKENNTGNRILFDKGKLNKSTKELPKHNNRIQDNTYTEDKQINKIKSNKRIKKMPTKELNKSTDKELISNLNLNRIKEERKEVKEDNDKFKEVEETNEETNEETSEDIKRMKEEEYIVEEVNKVDTNQCKEVEEIGKDIKEENVVKENEVKIKENKYKIEEAKQRNRPIRTRKRITKKLFTTECSVERSGSEESSLKIENVLAECRKYYKEKESAHCNILGIEMDKRMKKNLKKLAKKFSVFPKKSKGYEYWENIVKKWHIPTKDEWKVIELEIIKMKQQKDSKCRFNFVKLSELIK